MKKLIFIDNDNLGKAKEDVDDVKIKLELYGILKEEYVETISIISDFSRMDKDEAYKLLFSTDNCICSWSMYTANHYGSLYQLLNFLKAAGEYEIKNKVYIDCSGMLPKALEGELKNSKHAVAILNAIETNYIISFSHEREKPFRVRVDLKGFYENIFKFEDVNNLEELLNT
jgi:hypothetical protein